MCEPLGGGRNNPGVNPITGSCGGASARGDPGSILTLTSWAGGYTSGSCGGATARGDPGSIFTVTVRGQ